jgi:hypothetical protein
MIKPIAVLYVPDSVWVNDVQTSAGDVTRSFSIAYPDYYWFVWPDSETQTPYLQVFHEKDFTPIQYEELLKLVEQKLEEIKNKKDA